MKKLLFIIFIITSLFSLSCNHNKVVSPSYIGRIGEITVNPYGVTPLSAVYTTERVNGLPITVKVKGLYGEPDIIHTYPAGYGTEFEIHGMFPESMNTIEVNDGGRIITKNVSIGALSYNGITIEKQYKPEINNLSEEKYTNNPELYFFSNYYMIGISRNGYVRYALIGQKGATSKILVENNKLVVHTGAGINDISTATTFIGKNIITYPVSSHHDIIKIGNNYSYLGYSTWGWSDKLVKMDGLGNKLDELSFGTLIQNAIDFDKYPEDEEVFKKIVFSEDVNNIYVDSSGQKKWVDWAHANSIVYDSSTDILYASLRHRGVWAINYSEWKLIWWLADNDVKLHIGSGVDGLVPYNDNLKNLKSLDPYRVKGAAIDDGPEHQHALFLHKNGNIGMFDNAGYWSNNPLGSRYVEYKIIGYHGNYVATKVDEYRDPSLYAGIRSDVDFVGENYENLLIYYGVPTSTILEMDKDTKNILFKLNLELTGYRIDKMPLYYDEGRVYSEDCNLKNPN